MAVSTTLSKLTTLSLIGLVSLATRLPVVAAPDSKSPAPAAKPAAAKSGELETINISGKSGQKLEVGKMDPPAAFNLEDIQNFPEDRLQPVLTNPVRFDEGKDFSAMMGSQNPPLYHPWIPEIPRKPFLKMRSPVVEKVREWRFAVIDQAGTPVFKTEGKGTPPQLIIWNGEDSKRDYIAVDTVYIPQLSTVDKDGYHHTHMGQPTQVASIVLKDKGKTVIELSSKRLFLKGKAEFSKEADAILEKVCDVIREESFLPFAIQPYDPNTDLAVERQKLLAKYFIDKLVIPANQIVSAAPADSDAQAKRGESFAIIASGTTGGRE
jgi:flagellar motor protein MotB